MVSSELCGLCNKVVRSNHRAIQCDICDKWIHAKCNHINKTRYETFIETSDLKWNCFKCDQDTIPFANSCNEEFRLTMQGKNPDLVLLDEVSKEDNHIFQNLNDSDIFDGDELSNQSNYYTISEINDIKTKENLWNAVLDKNTFLCQLILSLSTITFLDDYYFLSQE